MKNPSSPKSQRKQPLPKEEREECASDEITRQKADVGERLRVLRERCGLSLRRLAEQAGVTAGIISCIERGLNSPSLSTMHKILAALNTDIASFFGGAQVASSGPVYPREKMRLIRDNNRNCTIVLPRSDRIAMELFDEHIPITKSLAEFEALECDVAGYILSGSIVLEVKDRSKDILRCGDAFYVEKDKPHRKYVMGQEPARLLTVYSPARY